MMCRWAKLGVIWAVDVGNGDIRLGLSALGSKMGEYPVGSFPHRILIAEGQVILPITLGQLNCPVVVGVEKSIVGHVVYIARAAATVEIALEIRVNARPHP
jgi:hypothetical protein